MQLDILWELDTNDFECTDSDSDIQEGYPLPSPPLPLSAINFKWSLISLYEAVICGENTREVAKNMFEYFDS